MAGIQVFGAADAQGSVTLCAPPSAVGAPALKTWANDFRHLPIAARARTVQPHEAVYPQRHSAQRIRLAEPHPKVTLWTWRWRRPQTGRRR